MSTNEASRQGRSTPTPENDSQLLATPQQVAELLQISTRSLWRMRNASKLPPPVKLGASVRWRRDQIEQWVRDGCPAADRNNENPRSR